MDQNSLTTDEAKEAHIDELLKKLSANQRGLSSSEAEKRLVQYGPNEIQEKKANPLKKFLRYFWGPIPFMIEAAVIMSAVIQRWPDFAIILTLLMVNAIVGARALTFFRRKDQGTRYYRVIREGMFRGVVVIRRCGFELFGEALSLSLHLGTLL
jgi:magnesium-transporting ATPase (P-type)